MPFGKHKGCPLTEIPAAYLRWVLRNCTNLEPGLKHAIKVEYNRRGVAKKKPLDRREEYQAAYRTSPTRPIHDVMQRTVNVLAEGEQTDVFQPGPLLDELWELIAQTHAEIRPRDWSVDVWQMNLETLTRRSDN
jgi:hypothetical protein